jgi:8-oxo-dGTP pyrophosphatase MutT (NUDIX family)
VDARGDEVSPFYVVVSADWVCVVPFTSSGDLLLVQEYRHGAGVAVLGFPGGRIEDSDDSAAAAAQRELLEETGFQGTEAVVLGSVWANAADRTNRVHIVAVTDVYPVAAPTPEPGEQPMVHTMAYEEFKRDALSRTSQSFHIAAIPFIDRWRAIA